MSNPNGGQGYDIRLNGSDIWVVGVNGWDVNIAPNNDSVTLNTWHHIALSCTADTAYLFVDGVLQGTSPRSDMSWPFSTSFQIGYQANFGGENYSGYMDEFRYSDVALWTANFPPPTAPAPLPASVLLLGSGLLGLGLLKRRRRI